MRRAVVAATLICVLGGAAFALAGYKAVNFEGGIGPAGERRPFELTYEKLSKRERLVNEAHFTKLTVECNSPGSDQPVEGLLAAFHQPSEAWVLNKKKGIGGRKDFAKVWKGKAVAIEAPDGSTSRFKGKRASLSGKFRKRFRKASGQFSIRWKQVDEDSGDVVYACGTTTAWNATKVRKKG